MRKLGLFSMEKALQRFHCILPQLEGGFYKGENNFLYCLTVTGLKEERFGLAVVKQFLAQRAVRHWHSLPREAVGAHPWRSSSPGWRGPWAPDLVGSNLAHGKIWNWVVVKVPLNLSHSVIKKQTNKPL